MWIEPLASTGRIGGGLLTCIFNNIAITRITNPYGHPNILAEFIAGQLKNRVSFCKAIKKAIELTEQADTKGIQVQIAGCLDGKEIAYGTS
ncbi:hypothetical protein EUGRSUZ_L01887 [Eucalyptus grandis]|uniref:Small ribosomal subunit protein uS3 C-terminal domain-containing protein n=1 Tax=Eucalyptus grandis TaxID=71139 RepID=A0A058ZU78_EUCGR|nr:hypothetical protein EUGRSUZ_L01887 [Eucalyptus grandis]